MRYTLLAWSAGAATATAFSTWCGKYYELSAPRARPDLNGRFSYPPPSPKPLLDFRCNTASSLYLPDDVVYDPPAMIFDADTTWDIGEDCETYGSDDF